MYVLKRGKVRITLTLLGAKKKKKRERISDRVEKVVDGKKKNKRERDKRDG